MVIMMKSKQEILDEARRHIAECNKRFAAQIAPMEDSVAKWRREGNEFAERERAERERRRANEQREQQLDPEAWDAWFAERLKTHLPAHLMPVVQGMAEFAETSGSALEELREQARERTALMLKFREEVRELKLEVARLNSLVAELNSGRAKVIDMPSWRDVRNVN